MPFTTREIESPDPVTRVAAADAALRESGQDDIGEKMVLNMGPSHPATHGVLRLVLELDGEIITKATPDIGFLHRGDEKIAENMLIGLLKGLATISNLELRLCAKERIHRSASSKSRSKRKSKK